MNSQELLRAALHALDPGAAVESFVADETAAGHPSSAPARLPVEGHLPSFDGATAWLNSPPLTVDDLRGKVVLVEFWTYTCINWLRTLSHVRAWAEKYRDHGLVVVGVHTPEFSFEHNIDNVRQALRDMRIDFPIAIDNDYAVWNAFTNLYWPAMYFVDASGRIRHHRFGEGDYEGSKRVIQQLLEEAGVAGTGSELVTPDARGAEVAANWDDLESTETYLGFARTDGFASPGGVVRGSPRDYVVPAQLKLNHWALNGNWTVESEACLLNQARGRIVFQFHARDVHLVMGPATQGSSVEFHVTIDGLPARRAHGFDVDEAGNGTVDQQRLYQLIRQPAPVRERRFEIEFLDSGAAAYAFTFG